MKIRLLFLTFLLLLSLAPSARARLGETENAVIGRYGKANYKMHRPWCDQEGFFMNGFSITVTFINGVSVGELYQLKPGSSITDELAVELLEANCEGYSWDELSKIRIPKNNYPPIKQMWQRPNGSTAVLTATSFEFKSINLILAEEEEAAKPKAVTPSTQGF